MLWGPIFAGVTAVSAFGAMVGAGVAARATWQTLKAERGRDRERAEERRRAQAEMIAAWPEYRIAAKTRIGELGPGIKAILVNGSSLPVWDVTVEWIGVDLARPWVRRGTHEVIRLSPGGDVLDPAQSSCVIAEDETEDRFALAITFRDAAGSWWRRDEHGILAVAEARPVTHQQPMKPPDPIAYVI